MNRSGFTARTPAAALLAAAASGLVLAGCGSNSASGSPAGASGPAASPSGSAAAGTASGGNTSVTSAAFFPLAVGNKWVYAVKGPAP